VRAARSADRQVRGGPRPDIVAKTTTLDLEVEAQRDLTGTVADIVRRQHLGQHPEVRAADVAC